MSYEERVKVKALLAEHERAIVELHKKLADVAGADKHHLAVVLGKHLADHKTFEGDCLECWKST